MKNIENLKSGDIVKVIDKEQKKLPNEVYKYLLSKNLFKVISTTKGNSENLLVDIGCKWYRGEAFFYSVNRFELVDNSSSTNDVDFKYHYKESFVKDFKEYFEFLNEELHTTPLNPDEEGDGNTWSDEEVEKLHQIGFHQEGSIFTTSFSEKPSMSIVMRRLKDIIWILSKEGNKYKIRAKFPSRRSHLNKGEKIAITGKSFDNIDEIPNILDKLVIDMKDSPDIYNGNG